ncbi:NS3 [Lebombo virus]|uniref:NS3 n=1 Tax=Lebombo virus TaxID=40057 RepID=W5QM00_9REOV|nr:NS3 [Lebombo virus]AFX73386.1 NS3 [Lebombo virus]
MLSTVFQHYDRNDEERALVPYNPRPPSYAPTAPRESVAMETISLGVLNQAMSNTTGANNPLKEEKAAFGAYAEAFRDPVPIREIKRRVGVRTVHKLEGVRRNVRRRALFVRTLLFVSGVIALSTSIVNTLSTFVPGLKLEEIGSDWLQTLIQVINLMGTAAIMSLSKYLNSLDQEISLLNRDIVKKKSYIDASNMKWDGNLETLSKISETVPT